MEEPVFWFGVEGVWEEAAYDWHQAKHFFHIFLWFWLREPRGGAAH